MSNFIETRQLLCTFSTPDDFKKTAKEILKFYNVYNNNVFVFCNIKNQKEIFLTYNVINTSGKFSKFPNTILIHRKKQSNTLYSLNALNVLVKEEHGCIDKTYILDWKLYQNSLIISGDVSVRIIPLQINCVIKQ